MLNFTNSTFILTFLLYLCLLELPTQVLGQARNLGAKTQHLSTLLIETSPKPHRQQGSLVSNLWDSKIKQIYIRGSSVFSQAELSAIVAPIIGKDTTIENLLELRTALTKLYTDNGYLTSAAFLPKQDDISRGIIEIQIVEGEVEALIIEGNGRLNSSYIRERLSLDVPLNVRKLEESLQVLQGNPLLEEISAELTTGTAPGLSILKLKIRESDSFIVQLGTDNKRTPSVGSQRRGLVLSQSNLLGNGEKLETSYFNSDGSNSVYLGLTIPVNSQDGTVNVATGFTFNEIVEQPFNLLDLETESRYYQLSFRQPIVKTPFEELGLGITLSRIENETFLDGIRFPTSRGASESGLTQISALGLFQDWVSRSEVEIGSLRSQFSFGLNLLDSSISIEPDSEFFEWNFQGQYIRQIASDISFILRSELQLADQPLLPDEQFRLGGGNSVRGYRQDLIVADNGFFVSAEVRLPILKIHQWDGVLQIAPFIDYGIGWNNSEFFLEPSSATSMGLGLRWQQSQTIDASLYWGIPLSTVREEKRTLQENGLYFNVRWNAF